MSDLNSFFNPNRLYTMPNQGGQYSASGTGPNAAPNLVPSTVVPPVTPQTFKPKAPIFKRDTTAVEQPPARSKYMNPETGKYFTPDEYANYVALKIPASKGTGDVSQYAGDALMNPDQSTTALNTTATNLNNARNDIATGTTDPYKVGNQSGIAYSPSELAAIEKAYAGVYDPALNDVFARLKSREDEEKRKADREDKIFATNESIRQWKATTGTKSTSSGADLFTQTQLNNGARNSGLGIEKFNTLDPDIMNFFIQPVSTPILDDAGNNTGRTTTQDKAFRNLIKIVGEGLVTPEDATEEIMSSNLPDVVKHYFIEQLPLSPEQKQGYFSKLWGAIWGK